MSTRVATPPESAIEIGMPIEQALDRLTELIGLQRESHGALYALLRRKREAIRTADLGVITQLCEAEQTLAGRMTDVEKERAALVRVLTTTLSPGARSPLALAAIVELAPPGLRPELEAAAEGLRAAVEDVRRESTIVSTAARALSAHMTGIMQSVNSTLSRVGVYERRGRIAVGSQMDFCVDIKS